MDAKKLGSAPAYPVPDLMAAGMRSVDVNPTTSAPSGAGLTKREAFALAALQGVLANSHIYTSLDKFEAEEIAAIAFELADAMLDVSAEDNP